MPLKTNLYELENLLKSFYTLTKLKVVIIDENYNEILSYPNRNSEFCSLIQSENKTKDKCFNCVVEFCKKCKEKNNLYISHCHTGLTEAVFPLNDKNGVMGYIMFGQTTEYTKKSDFINHISSCYKKYGEPSKELLSSLDKIIVKSHDEIIASAEILKTLANYISVKQLALSNSNTLIHSVYTYINEHIYEKITATKLAKALFICRTKLFYTIKNEINEGLSEYINKKKIENSKHELSDYSLSIKDIAEKYSFSSVNYYSKVFKKYNSVTPKQFRFNLTDNKLS